MLTYVNTLNLIRLGLHHKKQTIKIKKNKKSKRLINIFLKLNILFGWHYCLDKNKKLHVVAHCNSKLNKQVITLLKPSKQLYLKLKNLKKLSTKKSIHSTYLNTSKGIITIAEAITNSVGGILFFKIL